MQFRYRIINEEMRVQNGVLDAVDLETAKRQMLENHWQVISLEKVSGISRLLTISFKIKLKLNLWPPFVRKWQ